MDRVTRFILMLIFEVPAISLSVVIFVYFVFNRQVRSELKNHGWIVLLVVNFVQLLVDLPMAMSYYNMGYIWPATNGYCTWWTWYEYSLNTIGLFLMAWISIERHILVFYSHTMLQGPWRKCLFHFTPIIFCLSWAPIFFFVLVVISPLCTTQWDFDVFVCGVPCYYDEKLVSQFDLVFDLICPTMIIMLANVTLVIRVIYQKISRQQTINWRRHRKMILQLWIVSSLYMGFWLPVTIVLLVQNTILPSFMADQMDTMLFFLYFIPLLLPVICLSTLPELVQKMKNMITQRRLNVIGTVTYNRNREQIVTMFAAR